MTSEHKGVETKRERELTVSCYPSKDREETDDIADHLLSVKKWGSNNMLCVLTFCLGLCVRSLTQSRLETTGTVSSG